MLLVDLLCVIVFAHATQGRIYVLRDYDIEDKTRVNNPTNSKLIKTISNIVKFKPKKQAIVHYGRHIYHMDSFNKLHKLRSEHNPDYISYDYVDIGDINALKSGRSIPLDYLEDIVRLTLPCKGRKCKEDQRKYTIAAKKNKLKKKSKGSPSKLDNKKFRKRRSKRFKVIDNRHKHITASKSQEENTSQKSSKENQGRKEKQTKFSNKKKIKPESASSESNESKDSNSESVEDLKVKKNNSYSSESESDSSSEESTEAPKKGKKKYFSSDSESNEDSVDDDFSNSIEESQLKRKKKKQNYGSSEEMRKQFNSDGLFLQGNKMYDANRSDKDLEDIRRRLPQFLPKRYHWDPSDIHDLGYYWFNGPKGRYPAPTSVS